MSKQRYVDFSVGLFMLLGVLALLVMAMKVSKFSGFIPHDTYEVTAGFTDIGGLKIRAPVTVAGVKIGEVTHIELQPQELNAKVTMRLRSDKKLGMTCVIDNKGYLVGIYTDGDVRRTLTRQYDINTTPIKEVMTRNARTITKGMLAAEALAMMQKHSITSLIVIDEEKKPTGVLHLHDLLKEGVF